jgi:hypothetical protein
MMNANMKCSASMTGLLDEARRDPAVIGFDVEVPVVLDGSRRGGAVVDDLVRVVDPEALGDEPQR